MGYFPNSDAGLWFEDEVCSACHFYDHQDPTPERPACPVWLAHLLANYDQCETKRDDKRLAELRKALATILDMLIPRQDNGVGNERCAMFVHARDVVPGRHKQAELTLEDER